MADLVPSHLGFEDTVGAKSKQRAVTNIMEWLEAFAIYVLVVARKQLQRVLGLRRLCLHNFWHNRQLKA